MRFDGPSDNASERRLQMMCMAPAWHSPHVRLSVFLQSIHGEAVVVIHIRAQHVFEITIVLLCKAHSKILNIKKTGIGANGSAGYGALASTSSRCTTEACSGSEELGLPEGRLVKPSVHRR